MAHQQLAYAKKCFIQFFILFFLTVIYASLGACLFLYIEHCYDVVPAGLSLSEKIAEKLCMYLKLSSNTSQENSTLHRNFTDDCKEYELSKVDITCILNGDNFTKWFKYTMSAIYTIGYGVIVTRSDLGKIVTMLYTPPGLGLAVGSYIPAGNGLVALTTAFVHMFERKIMKAKEIKCCELKVLLIQTFLSIAVVIGIGAWVTIDDLEDYRFLDGVYYAFITVTTIGFGDFEWKFELYYKKLHLFLFTATFYSIGLGLFASLATSISACVSKYSYVFKICCRKREEHDEEEQVA